MLAVALVYVAAAGFLAAAGSLAYLRLTQPPPASRPLVADDEPGPERRRLLDDEIEDEPGPEGGKRPRPREGKPRAARLDAGSPPNAVVERPRSVAADAAAPTQRPAVTEPPRSVVVGSAAEGVADLVRQHKAEVDGCYDQAFPKGTPAPGGVVSLNFLIGSQGRAGFVRVVANSTGSAAVEACLIQLINRWTFPYATTGDFGVSHAFRFPIR